MAITAVVSFLGELPVLALVPRQGRDSSHSASPLTPGAERDPGLPHLSHEAGPARPSPRGPDPRRPVWERRVPVWARLLHPAAAPENHRGGTCHHRHTSCVRVHGAGGLCRARWGASAGVAVSAQRQQELAMVHVAKVGGCPRRDGVPSWR